MPAPGQGDPEADMQALERAVDAIEADGADADAVDVSGAVDVLNALDGVAEAEAAEDPDAADARQELLDMRDGLVAIEEGDEPELPIEELQGKLDELRGMIAMAALKQAMAGAV